MSTRIAPPTPGERLLRDLPAPAKLNLFLHVVGRRDDGYHLLQSVFALVDWCDTLSLCLRDDGHIQRIDTTTTLPSDDLCVQAAKRLQALTGTHQGVDITLNKQLPMQAGLGGGSSDAATTLIALNRLWQLGLSRTQLIALGAELGADVPFFIGGHNAWVEGIGERLQALSLPPRLVTIVKPPQGVSTLEIFRHPDLKRDTNPATMADFAGSRGDSSPYTFGRNDLQPLATRQCPAIQQCIDWLESKNLAARMSGSGSAVFAVHTVPIDVSDAPSDWVVRQTCIMDAHPLLDW